MLSGILTVTICLSSGLCVASPVESGSWLFVSLLNERKIVSFERNPGSGELTRRAGDSQYVAGSENIVRFFSLQRPTGQFSDRFSQWVADTGQCGPGRRRPCISTDRSHRAFPYHSLVPGEQGHRTCARTRRLNQPDRIADDQHRGKKRMAWR